jgi:hypothetical protein
MKIGFFGDSWSGCRPEKGAPEFSWPFQVTKLLNCDSVNYSLPGSHLFNGWLELKKHIDEVDYVVITISDPYRFPNDFQIPTMNCGLDENIAREVFGEGTTKKYSTFVELYYRFFSREFMLIAQKGLLKHIDDFVKEKKKPCLALPGFALSMQGFEFENAAFLEPNLSSGIKYKRYDKEKPTANHLNERENLVLAQAVADFIKGEYRTGKISFKKYFEYLDN